MTPDVEKAWTDHLPEEPEMVEHQAALLDQALSGKLTEDELNTAMRDYWFNGLIGRCYVLGAEMMAAIYHAFGKDRVLEVMQDPRRLFEAYNAALDAKPKVLGRCVRMPEKAVKQALAIPK
jgi:hypothetical protein